MPQQKKTEVVIEHVGEDYSGLNIYQKLAKVQRAVDILQKDKAGYNYRYVSDAELLPKINAEIDKYGLTLYPQITPGTTEVNEYCYEKTKGNKVDKINEFVVRADLVYVWVNNDRPEERILVPWSMVGNQADSSQAFGSALTYCNRYFLLKYFHCATVEDDPDNIRSKQRAGQTKNELDELKNEIDGIIQAILAESPDEKKRLGEMVTKAVDKRDEKGNLIPTNNYFNITKKAQANSLLRELKKTYKLED